MQVRDLSPKKDPKGGATKTPRPIPVSGLPRMSIQNPFKTTNDGFWKITLGNILGPIIVIITVVFAAGRVNERLDSIWSWKESVDRRFEHYDDVGTKALTAHIGTEELKQIEQDRRINNIEHQLDGVVPDVREIKTKIDIVTNLLKEQQASKR